jgi:phosphoribosylformimino-5-aminoimidazole carboxamide ribotide isomerase
MSFIVCASVDIVGGRCARPLRALGASGVAADDPIAVAAALAAAGARRLHVVDLDAARAGGAANRALLLETVRRAPCPVQAGGGVRALADVEEILGAGADLVLLSARALDDTGELWRACSRHGRRLGGSLDARRAPDDHDWVVGSGAPLVDAARAFERAGAALLVLTDVTRDGSGAGPNLECTLRVADATSLPVLAAGGVASAQDVVALARLAGRGVAGAVVGRALYEGSLSVADANRVADEAAA